jgi:hypothetical protein
MEEYSHGSFQVSGYKVTINNPKETQDVIQAAWERFMEEEFDKIIEHKAYQHLHVVYYNYHDLGDADKEGYDMLLGCVTEDGSIQSNSNVVTITVPAQSYKYIRLTSGNFTKDIPIEWEKINSLQQSEVDRNNAYDLEMYSEDNKTVTIAVGIHK